MQLSALGVTPQKAGQFNKKGIYTAEDLVAYLPRGYKDFRAETGILPEEEVSCLIVHTTEMYSPSQARTPYFRINGTILATGHPISITFFRQNFLQRQYAPLMGQNFYIAGKVKWEYERYQIVAPELCVPLTKDARKIYPVYRKIEGMSEDYLREHLETALSIAETTKETLPQETVKKLSLMSRKEALYHLHFPQTMENVEKARERVLFDDLLYFAIHNEWAKKAASPVSPVTIMTTRKTEELINSLPYQLTDDQRNTVMEMIDWAKQHKRVNALVQGDVGCGKTIIAILLMVVMAENHYQAVLMAPTQVLAQQHYEEISRLTELFGFKTVFLGASQKAKEKKEIIRQIAAGEADFIVGTHAVLGNAVTYKKLGITITDEEHKFGVAQRTALVEKAAEGVHSVTMSATPIPRTLAQVVYGAALQLYSIHTMPNGRKPVITGIATTKKKLYSYIVNQAKQGHQAYVVCPLIDASEKMEGVKSVEEVYQEYQRDIGVPYGLRIEMLSGRTSKADTENILARLKAGEIDVLISTTVVEVGVNVPTATLMVISNAERFGLASLHQLRGRVGRSSLQAYCVLDADSANDTARERLQVLVNSTDGFKIAEEDLKLRGAGDLLGTKQAGGNRYMELMMMHPEIYKKAQDVAVEFLANDTQCPMMTRIRQEREEEGEEN